jgi:hypothetical protein
MTIIYLPQDDYVRQKYTQFSYNYEIFSLSIHWFNISEMINGDNFFYINFDEISRLIS